MSGAASLHADVPGMVECRGTLDMQTAFTCVVDTFATYCGRILLSCLQIPLLLVTTISGLTACYGAPVAAPLPAPGTTPVAFEGSALLITYYRWLRWHIKKMSCTLLGTCPQSDHPPSPSQHTHTHTPTHLHQRVCMHHAHQHRVAAVVDRLCVCEGGGQRQAATAAKELGCEGAGTRAAGTCTSPLPAHLPCPLPAAPVGRARQVPG